MQPLVKPKDAAPVAIKLNLAPAQHRIGDTYGQVAGHVVIASAGQAHGGIAGAGANGSACMLDVLGGGHLLQTFEHAGDFG